MLDKYGKNVISDDVCFEIGRGKLPGYIAFDITGDNGALGTTLETIWDAGGLYTYPASASQMIVSSESDNDIMGGTGARSVFVAGLDADGYWQYEIVPLNGQAGYTTEKTWSRINYMEIYIAGSLGYNEDKVYIGTGALSLGIPANIYGLIDGTVHTHDNVMKQAVFSVPKGYMAHIVGYVVGVQAAKEVTLSFYERSQGGLFHGRGEVILYQSPLVVSYSHPVSLSELKDMEIRGFVDAVTTFVRVNARLVLERVDDSVPFILPNFTTADTWPQ